MTPPREKMSPDSRLDFLPLEKKEADAQAKRQNLLDKLEAEREILGRRSEEAAVTATSMQTAVEVAAVAPRTVTPEMRAQVNAHLAARDVKAEAGEVEAWASALGAVPEAGVVQLDEERQPRSGSGSPPLTRGREAGKWRRGGGVAKRRRSGEAAMESGNRGRRPYARRPRGPPSRQR